MYTQSSVPPYQSSPWTEEVTESIHKCEPCLKGEYATPLLFAFRVLGVPPHQRYELMNFKADADPIMTFFEVGWSVGSGEVEFGHEKDPFKGFVMNPRKVLAWLIGYTAGRYALDNGFDTPWCKHEDPSHHLPTLGTLEYYIHMVEEAGQFPTDSLQKDPVARAMIQPMFDTDQSFPASVAVIGHAVSLGMVDIKTIHLEHFGVPGTPVLISSWGSQVESLDNNIRGWYWGKLDGCPTEIVAAAMERRIKMTGSHGHEVSRFNMIFNEPIKANPTGVVQLDAHRRNERQTDWPTQR